MVVKYSLNNSDQIVMSFCFEDNNFHDDVCYAVYINNFGFKYDITTNREKEEIMRYLNSKGLKCDD